MSDESLEELIHRLPELLKERPDLAERLYAVLKDRLVTNEFLKAHMEASDKRFKELLVQMERRFEVSDKRWEELRADTNQRFEASEKRWEELRADTNQRFEASEKRWEALRTDTQQKFEASEKRWEALRADTQQKFEASEKRWEALRADTQQKFEASEKHWEALRVDTQQKFEASEKRWEELRADTNQRFEELVHGLMDLKRGHLKLEAAIGSLGRRSGIHLERTILNVFRRALELRGIDVEKVEKIGIRDQLGELYGPGAKVEYDVYIHNGEHFLFEIKYHATEEDVEVFWAKVRFFEQKKGVSTHKIVIALEIDEYAKRLCEDREIEVITE